MHADSSRPLLAVRQLSVAYGKVPAVVGATLHVNAGEIVALLGSNGAGKTTTLRAISGLTPAIGGTVTFDGRPLLGRKTHEIVRLGLNHVLEGRRVFGTLTVEENLKLGGYLIRAHGGLLKTRLDQIYSLFPVLGDRKRQLAGLLSGGEQQMLAVGRALMTEPRLLALDEPSLGLSPRLSAMILGLLAEMVVRGISVLLVEQNARQALQVADRAYILENGRVTLSGPAEELERDPRVAQAYLGETIEAERDQAAEQ